MPKLTYQKYICYIKALIKSFKEIIYKHLELMIEIRYCTKVFRENKSKTYQLLKLQVPEWS